MDAIIAHQSSVTKQKRRAGETPALLFCLHFPSRGSTLLGLDLLGPLEDDFEGVVEQGIAAAAVCALGLVGEAGSSSLEAISVLAGEPSPPLTNTM